MALPTTQDSGGFVRRRVYRRARTSGFVLVAVLWVLVIMTLAASAFSGWVDLAREEAIKHQQQLDAKLRTVDLLARLSFAYATSPRVADGLVLPAGDGGTARQDVTFTSLDDFMAGAAPVVKNLDSYATLRMDDSVLAAGDGVRFSIQDRGGLIGVSFLTDRRVFQNLLSQLGGRATPDQLRDWLHDYQDADDYKRLNGAESMIYQQSRRPPPRNAYLRWPLELRKVLGWDELLASMPDGELLRVFKDEGSVMVNVNSAPLPVLKLLFSNEQLNTVLQQRSKEPIRSVSSLASLAYDDGSIPLSVIPSEGFRLWVWHENSSTAEVYDVQFSHLNAGRSAWYYHWSVRVALPHDLASSTVQEVSHPFFR